MPDRPSTPALIMALAGVAVVLARLLLVADGDISAFVLAGSRLVDPEVAGIHVEEGSGYDGQAAYRLALAPWELDGGPVEGARLDGASRISRIAYPALAWLVAGGQHALVPWSLVAVNLAALTVLGWCAGRLAQQVGRHAIAGLLVSGWAGFVMSLARDLTEIVSSAGIVAALVALRARRPGVASAALTLAVLARETALAVPVALALVRFWQLVRPVPEPAVARPAAGSGPGSGAVTRSLAWRRCLGPVLGRSDLVWAGPIGAFVAWQVACWVLVGELPLLDSARVHLFDPEVGATSSDSWLRVDGVGSRALKLAQLALLGATAVLAGREVVRPTGRAPWEAVAWLVAAVLAARVWSLVWNDWASFRAFSELYVLAAVLTLAGRGRLRGLWVWTAAVWLATAGWVALRL